MTMAAKKCPVCAWEIKDGGKKLKVKDRLVEVCCDECAAKVKEDPGKYAGVR